MFYFNPRSPWGERHDPSKYADDTATFQSTLPVGGATVGIVLMNALQLSFQSTLPVGGATIQIRVNPEVLKISIHAPRGGSDVPGELQGLGKQDFNPRSPWGSDCLRGGKAAGRSISIHAPRGGSDRSKQSLTTNNLNFNPRSPWGERPNRQAVPAPGAGFQSTLPVGGATFSCRHKADAWLISIHAPRGGSDSANLKSRIDHFKISIHAPRGGSDVWKNADFG